VSLALPAEGLVLSGQRPGSCQPKGNVLGSRAFIPLQANGTPSLFEQRLVDRSLHKSFPDMQRR
jgi:hypothetical protein